MIARWQDDEEFVAFLLDADYAHVDDKGELQHRFSGLGIVIYMWEAFEAGRLPKSSQTPHRSLR